MSQVVSWLLGDVTLEVKYRTMIELLGMSKDNPEAKKTHDALLGSKSLGSVMDKFARGNIWEHINAFLALAEFGLTRDDVPIDEYVERGINNRSSSQRNSVGGFYEPK